MENRIKINGAWYVKEENTTPFHDLKQDIYITETCWYENDKLLLEAVRYPPTTLNYIKITSKIFQDSDYGYSSEDYWTDIGFIRKLYNGDPDAIHVSNVKYSKAETLIIRSFIHELVNNKWISPTSYENNENPKPEHYNNPDNNIVDAEWEMSSDDVNIITNKLGYDVENEWDKQRVQLELERRMSTGKMIG